MTPAALACQGGGILGFSKNETTGEGLLTCGEIGDVGFSNYEWGVSTTFALCLSCRAIIPSSENLKLTVGTFQQSEFNPPATFPLVMGPLDGLAYFEGMAVAAPDSSAPVDITTIGSPLGAVAPILLRWLGTAD